MFRIDIETARDISLIVAIGCSLTANWLLHTEVRNLDTRLRQLEEE